MTEGLTSPPFASMFAKPEEVGPPKSIMIYGAPGTRKTSTVGELIKVPGFDKILYLDIDNGTEVFINDPEVYGAISNEGLGAPGVKTINIIPIDKTSADAYGMLKYLLGYRDENNVSVRGSVFGQGYDAIVLDAADVAQEVAIQWLMANVYNDKGKIDTRGAWGVVSEWMSDVAWAMQNDPRSVGVMVVHSKEGTEENGTFKIKPKFSGSIKDSIAGTPSLVAYVEFVEDAEKKVHLAATVGDSSVITSKNRYMLPSRIDDFTMPKLYALIAEGRAKTLPPIPSGVPPLLPPVPATTDTAAVAA